MALIRWTDSLDTNDRCDTTNLHLCLVGKDTQVLVRQQAHRTHDRQLHDGRGTPKIVESACHIPVPILEQLVGSKIAIMRGPIPSLDARSQLIQDTQTVTLQKLAVHALEVTPIGLWNVR